MKLEPISTCPMDEGMYVLGWDTNMFYVVQYEGFSISRRGELVPAWYDHSLGEYREPTHWCHLPDEPEET